MSIDSPYHNSQGDMNRTGVQKCEGADCTGEEACGHCQVQTVQECTYSLYKGRETSVRLDNGQFGSTN